MEQKHGPLPDNLRGIWMRLTSGVCGIHYAFPGGPALRMTRPANVLISHQSHTSSALNSSVTLHMPIHLWTTVESLGHVWIEWPLCQGTGTPIGLIASHLVLHRWIWSSTTQHWSCNRLSSSTESSSLEHARRNGNIQQWTSHTIMMMNATTFGFCLTGLNFWSSSRSSAQQQHARQSITDQLSNLPPIVFSIQQKVGANDGNTDCDDSKYDEDKQHKSIHVIDLVRPERREDEVPAPDRKMQSASAHKQDKHLTASD